MPYLDYSLGGVLACLLAWALVAIWIRVSLRAKILDVPNARSSHVRATPRGGGVGIVATVLMGMTIVVALGRISDEKSALVAGALALAVAIVSFMDDVRSLPSIMRLGFQVIMAFVAVRQLGAFPAITIPFLEPVVLPSWVMVVLTILWIVGLTNVYNFMDGIDGIAGAQGLVGGLAWSWFGVMAGVPLVAWSGALIAAACLGFLFHNWAPAKVFMGDVGSAFLGFVFALLPLLALHGLSKAVTWPLAFVGAIPVFAAVVVWPFLADGAFTVFRRVKHRENLLVAHRSHLYQRLTITGWSHDQTTRLYVWWAFISAILGALYLRLGHTGRLIVCWACLFGVFAVFRMAKRAEARGSGGSSG